MAVKAVGSCQPEGPAGFDRDIKVAACDKFFIRYHPLVSRLRLEQGVSRNGPHGFVRPAPGLADVFPARMVNRPFLSVEPDGDVLTGFKRFGDGDKVSVRIFDRFLKILNVQ